MRKVQKSQVKNKSTNTSSSPNITPCGSHPAQFLAMQQQAREVFEHYLRPDAFSRELANMLRIKNEK